MKLQPKKVADKDSRKDSMEESAILGSKKHSEEEEEMSRQQGRRGMGRLTLQDSVENSFREKLVI